MVKFYSYDTAKNGPPPGIPGMKIPPYDITGYEFTSGKQIFHNTNADPDNTVLPAIFVITEDQKN